MPAAEQGRIEVERSGSVDVVTIVNPARRNAVTDPMAQDLEAALTAADARPQTRAVVVTGAGAAFSSGHDIDELVADPSGAWDDEANRAFELPRHMETPVLAAIDGPAYAAGLILALACDLRFASPAATFCASGARLGLLPIGGQLAWLPRAMPAPLALRMLLTAEPISAEVARDAGFVAEIVPAGELLARTVAQAETIAAHPPALTQAIKRAVWRGLAEGPAVALDLERAGAREHAESAEARERLAAFVARRARPGGAEARR